MSEHQGQCCCGACVIAFDGATVMNGVCHCDDCRRRTGSAFGWSIYVRDDQITEQSGPFGAYEPAATPGTTRLFCSLCGSTLAWKSDAFMAGHTGIAGGCLQTPPEPAFSARNPQAQHWLHLPDAWLRMD